MYFRFFVFVCLCAAVYGVIKNNNLVRLSSIVPFRIIYQVNLYWRNNSAHKYNYFQTLFHTLAFHTNFSRSFHPCNLVPHFHVSHFQSPPQDDPCRSYIGGSCDPCNPCGVAPMYSAHSTGSSCSTCATPFTPCLSTTPPFTSASPAASLPRPRTAHLLTENSPLSPEHCGRTSRSLKVRDIGSKF